MKLIRQLFLLSIIFSIASIVGVSVWTNNNDFFTYSSSYEFYWFVSITSLLFSLFTYFVHSIPLVIDTIKKNITLMNLHLFTVTVFGITYTIFWLGTSASVASDLRYCIFLKNTFKNTLINCQGKVVSTFFGFCNFILWSVILYYSCSYWYSVYIKKVNVHDKIELPPIPVNDNEVNNGEIGDDVKVSNGEIGDDTNTIQSNLHEFHEILIESDNIIKDK